MPTDPRFFANQVDEMFDGVYFVDLERRITYWNKGAERITGFSAGEVLGRRCAENILVHVDDCGNQLCQVACPLAAVVRDNTTQAVDVFLHHKQGHRVPVSVRAAPMHDDDGNVVGAIEIFSDNSAKMAALEHIHELERTAYLDPLTALPNRRFGESFLAAKQEEQQRHGWPYGIVLLDLDRFKLVNDTFGHQAGDDLLRMVARTIAGAIRASDLACRWGGEEFLVILTNPAPAQLSVVARRLRGLIRASTLAVGDAQVRATASIGAVLAEPGLSPEAAIARADTLLYKSKEDGRDRVTFEAA
jgi:diguanylate cyclase (GGDEF)-like protein/PAS domain S-box-containing protein